MADNKIESRFQQGYGNVFFTNYKAGNEVAATLDWEWIVPFYGEIIDVICDAATAPAGSSSIIDVNINGTTIYTTQGNRPTLVAADTGYYTEAGEPQVVSLVPGDVLSYDVDQIGSGTAATRFGIVIVVKGV